MTNLSYDEWRAKHKVSITDNAIEGLKIFHGLDAAEEVEKLMRLEYETYLLEKEDSK
jgi:hypothetical protein